MWNGRHGGSLPGCRMADMEALFLDVEFGDIKTSSQRVVEQVLGKMWYQPTFAHFDVINLQPCPFFRSEGFLNLPRKPAVMVNY